MKQICILLLSLLFLHSFVVPTYAQIEPPVFSCQSPVGNAIADFNEGTHGIAGDSATYTGSDHVYQIDADHVVQCFCPSNGDSGIQSNWAKLSDISEETITYYQKLGWTYVPNGLAWGLDDTAYIVKNQSYTCREGSSNSDPDTSNSDSSNSNNSSSNSTSNSTSNSNQSQGQILGESILAATGNDRSILIYVALGLCFAFLAYRFAQE